jgi:hypothetical protein
LPIKLAIQAIQSTGPPPPTPLPVKVPNVVTPFALAPTLDTPLPVALPSTKTVPTPLITLAVATPLAELLPPLELLALDDDALTEVLEVPNTAADAIDGTAANVTAKIAIGVSIFIS